MRGSVIVAYQEGFQTFGFPLYRIAVNNTETRDYQFSEASSLYSTYIFSGDTLRANISEMGYGEIGSISMSLMEYTNDNEGGDNGVKVTTITGVTSTNLVTGVQLGPITINPSPNCYDFNVIVTMNITQGCAPIGVFDSSTGIADPYSIEIKEKNIGTTTVNIGDIYVGLDSTGTRTYTNPVSSGSVGSLVRLDKNYGIDFSFSTISSLGSYSIINDIEIQNDGRVLICGQQTEGSQPGFSVNRLSTSGALDLTFYRNSFNSTFESVTDISQQSTGKIIASGTFTTVEGTTYNRYVRLNYNGTIDNTFYSGGTGTGFSNPVNNIVDVQDRVYMFGPLGTTFNGSTFGGLLRLTKDGQLDTTFNGTGRGLFGQSTGGGGVNNVTILSDGKLLCSGLFNRYNGVPCPSGLVRLNEDGSLDTTFNPGGAGLSQPFSIFNVAACETVIDKQDVYLVLFRTNPITGITYNNITIPSQIFMVNNDGSLNMQFNTNAGTGLTGGVPFSLKRLSNDNVLIAGQFTNYNGTAIAIGEMIQISPTGFLQNC